MNPLPVIIPAARTVSDAPATHPPRELYRQWSALMLVLVLLGVILITAIAFIVARGRARRRKAQLPKPKPGPTVDAWAEAGRRIDDSITEIKDD